MHVQPDDWLFIGNNNRDGLKSLCTSNVWKQIFRPLAQVFGDIQLNRPRLLLSSYNNTDYNKPYTVVQNRDMGNLTWSINRYIRTLMKIVLERLKGTGRDACLLLVYNSIYFGDMLTARFWVHYLHSVHWLEFSSETRNWIIKDDEVSWSYLLCQQCIHILEFNFI